MFERRRQGAMSSGVTSLSWVLPSSQSGYSVCLWLNTLSDGGGTIVSLIGADQSRDDVVVTTDIHQVRPAPHRLVVCSFTSFSHAYSVPNICGLVAPAMGAQRWRGLSRGRVGNNVIGNVALHVCASELWHIKLLSTHIYLFLYKGRERSVIDCFHYTF